MAETNGIVLPTTIRKATKKNIQNMILFGKAKSGKTTMCCKLKNSLLIDLEKGSYFNEGTIIEPPKEYKDNPIYIHWWLKKLAEKIEEENHPYDYVIFDSLSQIDEWSNIIGTAQYMNTNAGQYFNRILDKSGRPMKDDKGKEITIPYTSEKWESVNDMAGGYGYKNSRKVVVDFVERMKNLGKICTIFICHLTDKMTAMPDKTEISVAELALTGALSTIIPRYVDAVAHIYIEKNKVMISFKGDEKRIGGVRSVPHLQNWIAKELNWSEVFLPE